MTALTLNAVRKSFGAAEIIRGVTLEVRSGERHALIGPNGAGKSTLFNLISGSLAPTSGSILLEGRAIAGLAPHVINRRGLARSFQVTNIFPSLTVSENLRCGVLAAKGHGLEFWRPLASIASVTRRTEELLELVHLQASRDAHAGQLAYAEQRALEIGMTIAGGARVILLDEPTAGMSAPETARAVELIRRVSEGRTLLIVEHDMGVVFGLADRISVLVYGEIIATGTPAAIRADARVQEAYLGEAVASC